MPARFLKQQRKQQIPSLDLIRPILYRAVSLLTPFSLTPRKQRPVDGIGQMCFRASVPGAEYRYSYVERRVAVVSRTEAHIAAGKRPKEWGRQTHRRLGVEKYTQKLYPAPQLPTPVKINSVEAVLLKESYQTRDELRTTVGGAGHTAEGPTEEIPTSNR